MKTYEIRNTTSGYVLGHYTGASALDAYLDLCHDAGHTPERDEEGEVVIPDDVVIKLVAYVQAYDTAVAPHGNGGPDDYPY